MFFQSWSEFIAMGGYGFYVWLAYGISLLVFAGLVWQSLRAGKGVLAEVRKEQQRELRLQQAQRGGPQL